MRRIRGVISRVVLCEGVWVGGRGVEIEVEVEDEGEGKGRGVDEDGWSADLMRGLG